MTRIRVNFNRLAIATRITNRIERVVQPILDNEVLKDSNFYVPMDTSNLKDSGIRGTRLGSGKIVWDAAYARRQYYEDNNKSKDNNPNASDRWFEKAKVRNKDKWIRISNQKGGFRR